MRRRRNIPAEQVHLPYDTLYHGTSSLSAVVSVLESGFLLPPSISGMLSREEGELAPMRGFVYMTPNWTEAARYAMEDLGTDLGLAFVFQVDPYELVTIEPDEDDLGQAIYIAHDGHYWLDGEWPELFAKTLEAEPGLRWTLRDVAQRILTPEQLGLLGTIADGNQLGVEDYAPMAKRMFYDVPQSLRIDVLEHGANVAHRGAVPVYSVLVCEGSWYGIYKSGPSSCKRIDTIDDLYAYLSLAESEALEKHRE